MKYTCSRCGVYTTDLKSNLKRHLNRKRKCTQIIQNEENIESKENHNESHNAVFATNRITKESHNPLFTQNNPLFTQEMNHNESHNVVLSSPNTVLNTTKRWKCEHCDKTFSTNANWNRHMRLYCRVKKEQETTISVLQEQVRQLKSHIEQQRLEQPPTSSHTNGSHNHNTNHSHNTTNNTINNYNINLPEGTWNRKLWGVMLFLISKTKGDRFSKGELEFNDAFGKTLSVAFHHPESPLYNSIQMLGRKEAWAKHNGKVVQKKKLLKKINKQHLDRLIQFIHEDNERFRTELPPVPVIEQWIQVNNDVIEHIKKYDPCDKTTIRESEEVFRSESLLNDFNSFVAEVTKNTNMDSTIAFGQESERTREEKCGH